MNAEKKRDAVGYKHCCVVDAQGHYVTLVLVLLEENEEGQVEERVQYYALQEGERLVEAGPPTARPYAGAAGFVSPVWDDGAWTEGASEEEIATWEAEHPAPELPEPPEPSGSMEQRVADLEEGKADKTEVAAVWDQMAEAYHEGVQGA